jgi:hypothetical protein
MTTEFPTDFQHNGGTGFVVRDNPLILLHRVSNSDGAKAFEGPSPYG